MTRGELSRAVLGYIDLLAAEDMDDEVHGVVEPAVAQQALHAERPVITPLPR
jgi:hypothetical protein